eukprot:TRINITY_DN3135_c0_g1_i2.p1 TRINITY_DN3135_c0_g1~~TRINITY_DN3135_c0_g1_i2.p1  ORF type:complete len:449 (-),score=86.19 TRINITY_DN3135_c0_g1_i2:43-1389(-)
MSNLDLAGVDWSNLEQRFNDLFRLLNAPSLGSTAHKAREKQKGEVREAIETLLSMTLQESRRLLMVGDAPAAIEGGLRTLTLKERYHGEGAVELVDVYFHLARCHQYQEKFGTAEEFLALAQWAVIKHPAPPGDRKRMALEAELHQTFGLLYASDGRLDVALDRLARATVCLSRVHGPRHVLSAFGFFDVGNVLAAQGNMAGAMAMYDHVKSAWLAHLVEVFTRAAHDTDDADAKGTAAEGSPARSAAEDPLRPPMPPGAVGFGGSGGGDKSTIRATLSGLGGGAADAFSGAGGAGLGFAAAASAVVASSGRSVISSGGVAPVDAKTIVASAAMLPPPGTGRADVTRRCFTPAGLGEENVQDALKMLRGIAGLQEERFGVLHPAPTQAKLVLGLFHRWLGDTVAAHRALKAALDVAVPLLGATHPDTEQIRAFMLGFGLFPDEAPPEQ